MSSNNELSMNEKIRELIGHMMVLNISKDRIKAFLMGEDSMISMKTSNKINKKIELLNLSKEEIRRYIKEIDNDALENLLSNSTVREVLNEEELPEVVWENENEDEFPELVWENENEDEFPEVVWENESEDLEHDEQPPIDIEKLSPKSRKLIEKVNDLCTKIEQEKNPIKRQMLSFRVQMLVNKIQKEIDVLAIKEEYKERREQLQNSKKDKNKDGQDKVAMLMEEIESIKEKIDSLDSEENAYNPEYDPEAAEFEVFTRRHIREQGGIENLLEDLRNSEAPASRNLAAKIEQSIEAREANKGVKRELENKLDEKRKELAKANTSLRQVSVDYNKDLRKSKVEETALVVKTGFNPLAAIKNVWKNIKDRWDDFKNERAEINAIREAEAEAIARREEALQDEIAKKEAEFRAAVEKLREEANIDIEKIQDKKAEEINGIPQDKARAFRQKVGEMAQQSATLDNGETDRDDQPHVVPIEQADRTGEDEPTL